MKILQERIAQNKILVSDGAWGTFLQQKGLQPGECPELWNATHADQVLEIAQSYIDAGADMIETNSFGGSPFKLAHYGLAGRAVELNRAAAEISRKAAGKDRIVLGSVGPTGKILMMGDVTEEELYNGFKEQAVALEKGGADAICIETMSALDEAKLAIQAAKENTQLEIICTFTFEKTVDGHYRTMMGVSPHEMAECLIAEGVDIIGSNCGNGMEQMVHIVKEIRQVDSRIPILVHANAGRPVVKDGKTVFPDTPGKMAGFIPAVIHAGANIVGGCCGTTPEHIKAIKAKVRMGRKAIV